MLVSSIGYFDATKTSNMNSSVKNQTAKANLTEVFGHVSVDSKVSNNDSGFLKNLVSSFRSLFSKNESRESSKYLSLVG